jgi:hypothetical protein
VLTGAAGAGLALVAGYVALGGASYRPAAVADPCAPRAWRAPDGLEEALEQIALSTADGAACRLGVPREEVVLALAGRDALAAFASENGVTQEETEDAVRAGLLRAVGDAERAGAIGGGTAGTLRTIAERLPIGFVLDLLRGAASLGL